MQTRVSLETLESRLCLAATGTLEVPALSSHPSASKQLYLDFDGEHAMRWGQYDATATPAYDTDGNTSGFSAGEHADIQAIWESVAGKYSAFNINVTTVRPASFGDGVALQVLIGGTGEWLGRAVGGIAYIGSFAGEGENTVFVFPEYSGGGDLGVISNNIAHEAGHAFGLWHRSTFDTDGTLLDTYAYDPAGLDGFIMGATSGAQRITWSIGPREPGPDFIQDDIAVLSSLLGNRADESQGTSTQNPIVLTPTAAGAVASGSGFDHALQSVSDVDYFAFDTGSGPIDLTVDVPLDSMLDPAIELLNANGSVIASRTDKAEVWQPLGKRITADVSTGRYFLRVRSTGGYSNMGTYAISGTIVPPASQTASITGRTFNDNNNDGLFDAGDTLITGKTVFLDSNNNGKLDTGETSTRSGSNGSFTFAGLAAGTYRVRRVFPTGYTYSNPPIDLVLSPGQSFSGADIGSVPVGTPPPVVNGSISGILYNDDNANGVLDAGETRISRVVYLDSNNNGKLDTGEPNQRSATDGTFTFADLSVGTYRVRRVFPSGYEASNPPRDYTLASGQIITGADIGSVVAGMVVTPPDTDPPPDPKTASISGFLFWDEDRDAQYDTGESLQSAKTVFIDLDDDNILDAAEARLTTDSQGRFTFTGLGAGTYIVKRVVPKGYAMTTPKQVVTLTPGQVFSGVAIGTNTL